MDRSELKRAYKEAKHPMGVYCIKNLQNDTVFVGFATDLQARINRHKAELSFGNHRNNELQKIWNALGESAFKFEVLDELAPEENTRTNPNEELKVLLDMWIQNLEKAGNSVVCL